MEPINVGDQWHWQINIKSLERSATQNAIKIHYAPNDDNWLLFAKQQMALLLHLTWVAVARISIEFCVVVGDISCGRIKNCCFFSSALFKLQSRCRGPCALPLRVVDETVALPRRRTTNSGASISSKNNNSNETYMHISQWYFEIADDLSAVHDSFSFFKGKQRYWFFFFLLLHLFSSLAATAATAAAARITH